MLRNIEDSFYMKGSDMKIKAFLFLICAGLMINAAIALDVHESGVLHDNTECTYNVLLILLEQGRVKITSYVPGGDNSESKMLFSLDLSDNGESYTNLVCNKDTNGVVLIRSKNELMCDYCLNWGAMLGIDLVQSQMAYSIPVKLCVDELGAKNIIVAADIDNTVINFSLTVDRSVSSAAALVVPVPMLRGAVANYEVMSFAQACCKGIIIAKERNDILQDPSVAQEIEFDRIIDAMMQDGTIKVRPVSPFMAYLRTIGSTLFVKYLAAKNVVGSWWKNMWSKQYGDMDVVQSTAKTK